MALATMFGVIALTAISFLIAGSAGDNNPLAANTTDTTDAGLASDDVAGLSVGNDIGTGTGTSTDESQGAGAVTQRAAIDPSAPQTIRGLVNTPTGLPVEGAQIELYERVNEDERGALLYAVGTDASGFYGISAPVGCYVVVINPPPGQTMADGSAQRDVPTCVNATIVRLTIDGQTSG